MAAIASEARDRVSYETELFRCIERMVGFDVAFFKRNRALGSVVRGPNPEWLERQLPQLFNCSDEALEVIEVALRGSGVAVDLDVLGRRRLERKRYYQVLMKPLRGTSSALLPVASRGECISTLVLGLVGRGHRPREVEAMQRFAPTLRLCEALWQARFQAPSLPAGSRLGTAASLTASEREVLSYLRLGYTNADIARARGNALRTVRNQLSSAYAKLGVASRAEAVAALSELEGSH